MEGSEAQVQEATAIAVVDDNSQALAVLRGSSNAAQRLSDAALAQVAEVATKRDMVLALMESVMVEGQHYGTIPGTGKPTLFQAGAELLKTLFSFELDTELDESWLELGENIHLRVACKCIVRDRNGLQLGVGNGKCSTMESKYRWRAGGYKCPECGKDEFLLKSKPPKRGYFCWSNAARGKHGCGAQFKDNDDRITSQTVGKTENNPADFWNTVTKMADKRAFVSAVKQATGASDVFAVDIEDMVVAPPLVPPKPALKPEPPRSGAPPAHK